MAKIENAEVEETRAQKLAFPEEDSESLSEYEGGEDLEDEDATSDEDQDTLAFMFLLSFESFFRPFWPL